MICSIIDLINSISNVKGSDFFTLHEEFEELYVTIPSDMDEVAERMLIIGGEPYSTLREFVEHKIKGQKCLF